MAPAEYPGTTTYAPTWLHIAAIIAMALLLTYPVSLTAGLMGLIPTGGHPFRRANRIAAVQVALGLLAFLTCAAICSFLVIAILFVGGLFVFVGLMQPVHYVVSWQLLAFLGGIHFFGQIVAYVFAERATRSEIRGTTGI